MFYLNSDINIARKDCRNIYLLPCNTSTNALSKWYIPKFLSHLQLSGIASYIFETNSSMLVTWVGKKSSLDQSELDKRRGGCAGHEEIPGEAFVYVYFHFHCLIRKKFYNLVPRVFCFFNNGGRRKCPLPPILGGLLYDSYNYLVNKKTMQSNNLSPVIRAPDAYLILKLWRARGAYKRGRRLYQGEKNY